MACPTRSAKAIRGDGVREGGRRGHGRDTQIGRPVKNWHCMRKSYSSLLRYGSINTLARIFTHTLYYYYCSKWSHPIENTMVSYYMVTALKSGGPCI